VRSSRLIQILGPAILAERRANRCSGVGVCARLSLAG